MPFLNRIGSGSTSKFGLSKGFRPGVPTSVTASLPNTFGNTTATVSWTAPLTVGAPALHDYVIQYSSDNGSTYTTFTDAVSNATTVTVTGLTNGFAYVFRVAAINQIGTGDFSSASNSVTPLNSKIPTPLFVMDDDTQGRVGIDFTNYIGSPIDQAYVANPSGGYFYNYFNCAGGFCPNDTSGTSHGWTGLAAGTSRSASLKVQRFGYADSDTVFCSETSPDAPTTSAPPFFPPVFTTTTTATPTTTCGPCGNCESYLANGTQCGCTSGTAIGYRCFDACGICFDDPCFYGCL